MAHKNIEEWLRDMIVRHEALCARNSESMAGFMHQERVFAYQNVLIEMGYETAKQYRDCLGEAYKDEDRSRIPQNTDSPDKKSAKDSNWNSGYSDPSKRPKRS